MLSPLITLEAEKRAVDLMNKDKDFVRGLETGMAKLIGKAELERLDINEKENEDLCQTCDGQDRIFGEKSSIGMMFHKKMKASG